jgi:hypothetical protein
MSGPTGYADEKTGLKASEDLKTAKVMPTNTAEEIADEVCSRLLAKSGGELE